jgi:hypothetical protein
LYNSNLIANIKLTSTSHTAINNNKNKKKRKKKKTKKRRRRRRTSLTLQRFGIMWDPGMMMTSKGKQDLL